jgi:hypothetical protein
MADGVMLAVRPPSGEKSPYAFGDSIQGSTKKTRERHNARRKVSEYKTHQKLKIKKLKFMQFSI